VCGLSVGRFVKYTGYGNAAGLLAQRGLMCGGHGAVYSSESDDSETEEYSHLKDKYERSRKLFKIFLCPVYSVVFQFLL